MEEGPAGRSNSASDLRCPGSAWKDEQAQAADRAQGLMGDKAPGQARNKDSLSEESGSRASVERR